MLDKEKDILYYIIHDQYSLLQAECELFCKQLQDKYDIEIICQNYTQVGPRPKDDNFDLAKCLESLKQSAAQDKNVHFFIDEFDYEHLTEDQCTEINLLNNNSLAESYVIIAIQSIEKSRSLTSTSFLININKSCVHFLEESMATVALTKVMRFTPNILSVADELQKCIKESPNSYQLFAKENLSSDNDVKDDNPVNDVTDDNLVNDVSLDRTCKLLSKMNGNHPSSLKETIETKFEYPAFKGCGHTINGDKPSLIRLPFNVDKSVVASTITKYVKPRFKRCFFICNDAKTATIAFDTAMILRLTVIPYLDGLTLDTSGPTKKEVYEKWNKTESGVLLTDNRGCRGLQNENVSFSLSLLNNSSHQPK